MFQEGYKEFIMRFHKEYKNLGYVECPAFGNEKIYFNKHGFNHLIRKGKDIRPISEQVRRIRLMTNAKSILSRVNKIDKHISNNIDGHPAFFWSLSENIQSMTIRIVIRKLGNNGLKHFYSIMDEAAT